MITTLLELKEFEDKCLDRKLEIISDYFNLNFLKKPNNLDSFRDGILQEYSNNHFSDHSMVFLKPQVSNIPFNIISLNMLNSEDVGALKMLIKDIIKNKEIPTDSTKNTFSSKVIEVFKSTQENRIDIILNHILTFSDVIICLQEVGQDMLKIIKTKLNKTHNIFTNDTLETVNINGNTKTKVEYRLVCVPKKIKIDIKFEQKIIYPKFNTGVISKSEDFLICSIHMHWKIDLSIPENIKNFSNFINRLISKANKYSIKKIIIIGDFNNSPNNIENAMKTILYPLLYNVIAPNNFTFIDKINNSQILDNCIIIQLPQSPAPPPPPPPAPPPQQSNQVWCYDFDGVVHTKMKKDENLRTEHRNPDKRWLLDNFTDSKFKSLIPYLFSNTINHMKYGQSTGAKIIIVSANSWNYKIPIYNILNYVGVKIEVSDIHMRVFPKDKKLKELNCTLFMDDSCANINKIYSASKNNIIPTLEKIVFVVPEKEKEYDSLTHYEIDLSKNLNICNKTNWHRDLSKVRGIKLLEYPKHTFKLTSWNVYFELMNPRFPERLNNIKKYLSLSYRKPDILFTQESHFDLPKPEFDNYEKIYWRTHSSAICTHFNKQIFRLNGTIAKFGFDDNLNVIDITSRSVPRPILGIKLTHIKSGKNIIFINVWAPHKTNDLSNPSKKVKFLSGFINVINKLYSGGERIIIAGDFNEFYEWYLANPKKGENVDILKLNSNQGQIKLYLKQRNNTCCGSTIVGRPGGLFDGITAHGTFDLLYDSDPTGSVVRVGTNRESDHLPISANITV